MFLFDGICSVVWIVMCLFGWLFACGGLIITLVAGDDDVDYGV